MTDVLTVFTVHIAKARNPPVFSVDHISRFVTENRQTAPKIMSIWVRTIHTHVQSNLIARGTRMRVAQLWS